MPTIEEINTADKAAKLIKDATPDYIKVNGLYMAGDHFQAGREWIGPPPPPDMETAAICRLEKSWCPDPIINEMIENHMNGIVGHEPMFELVQKTALEEGVDPPDDNELRDTNAYIGQWWDDRKGLETLQEWVQRLRWAGRATLRLFVPPDLMEEGDNGFTLPDGVKTPQDALQYIYFEAPDVESATVYCDPRSKREAGLYSYEEEVPGSGTETTKKRRVEMVFVSVDSQTVIRILEDDQILTEIPFPCGGESLMYESELPLLFTKPVRKLQQAVNMINTMIPLNASYAGFRSRDYINVQPPQNEDGEEEAPVIGPSQFMMWYSAPYYEVDQDGRRTGEIKYFPPQLITTEPVDSANLRADIDVLDRQIRRACKQEYTMLAGDGDSSAVALIQKRAVFANDLLKTKPAVEGALMWMQSAVWCFALYLSGNESGIKSFIDRYRATAMVKPYTGPLTPDEERVVLERVAAGLLSGETAMVLLGIEDPDAELEKIEAAKQAAQQRLMDSELFSMDAIKTDEETNRGSQETKTEPVPA